MRILHFYDRWMTVTVRHTSKRNSRRASSTALLVMVAAHQNFEPLVGASPAFDPVNQPMFTGDPAGPPACQLALQRLRLGDARERGALSVPDETGDPGERGWVVLRPILVVVPSVGAKMHSHRFPGAGGSISSWSVVRPASNSRG